MEARPRGIRRPVAALHWCRKESLMDNRFEVTVGAGTMRSAADRVVSFPHRWTPEGVTVDADFTGGHLLQLAAAGCGLNDAYLEDAPSGLELDGERGMGTGGVGTGTWGSAGINFFGASRSGGTGTA